MSLLAKRPLQAKKSLTEANLRECSMADLDTLYNKFDSKPDGLTNHKANKKLEKDGLNLIDVGSKLTTTKRILKAAINPFNIILIIIAGFTLLNDVVFSVENDYLTVSIIISMVVISSLISFIQGESSNRAAEKLSRMVKNSADVCRGGKFIELDMSKLVVGDIVKLAAGDMIPADVRFLTAKDLFIAQAALTGESNPVEKFADRTGADEDSLTDLPNIGFMGSNVVSGTATALIIATGNRTYFGGMAKSLSKKSEKNSFERGVDSVSRLLFRFMIIMVPIILIINGVTKHDWLSAMLFAVSVAVGLTPEMLPVIMTSTLAIGAVKMSKHKVIVKNIGSIQAFGEMDILCTDKTGTLTEDKIVLEKYINIHDEDDEDVLKYAFINSYFQTGLKNVLDVAVIDRANANGLDELAKGLTVADEIPYDFDRRRMSVVLSRKDEADHVITKGSVEEILSICKHVKYGNKIIALDAKMLERARAIYEKYTSEGIRMLAVAEKDSAPVPEKSYSVTDEADMVLIGFIGFLDPPKSSAEKAINVLATHGVRTVVLTGDSKGVAAIVCDKVGIDTSIMLSGLEVEQMSDDKLRSMSETCNLFYKLSPTQKERVVKTLQGNGHTVGYMGDGINDALPLKASDVGISVDNAVDIAKETADIILLEKDLLVLEEGVILGRTTFGNIAKYLKMATSGNFGNMFSVVIASIFLPFLPMLPVHILVQNLLIDVSQAGIPFDDVDVEYVKEPRKWDIKSIRKFMFTMGPISSIFDVLCFLILFFIIGANTQDLAPIFQAGWFAFGTVSQILTIHLIRTAKRPFIDSRASAPLLISTIAIAAVGIIIAFTNVGEVFNMMRLPLSFAIWLVVLFVGYSSVIEFVKQFYIKRYGEWL
jgi:Mg2+-importing ATPase